MKYSYRVLTLLLAVLLHGGAIFAQDGGYGAPYIPEGGVVGCAVPEPEAIVEDCDDPVIETIPVAAAPAPTPTHNAPPVVETAPKPRPLLDIEQAKKYVEPIPEPVAKPIVVEKPKAVAPIIEKEIAKPTPKPIEQKRVEQPKVEKVIEKKVITPKVEAVKVQEKAKTQVVIKQPKEKVIPPKVELKGIPLEIRRIKPLNPSRISEIAKNPVSGSLSSSSSSVLDQLTPKGFYNKANTVGEHTSAADYRFEKNETDGFLGKYREEIIWTFAFLLALFVVISL